MERPPSAYRMWLNAGGRNEAIQEFPGANAAKVAQEAQKKWDAMDFRSKQYWEKMHDEEYEKFKTSQTENKVSPKKTPENDTKETKVPSKANQTKDDLIKRDEKESVVRKVIKGKKGKTPKKNKILPVKKLEISQGLLKIKKECAGKDKKVSRMISKEGNSQFNKKVSSNKNYSVAKTYVYEGNDQLVQFGGIHNKYGSRAGNTLTIPTDVLPIAGCTKEILVKKMEDKSLVEISHLLKVHPDKSFGKTKGKQNIGTRIMCSIDQNLIDTASGLPKSVCKGLKSKKHYNALMYATETEKYCVALSVLRRLAKVAKGSQRKKLISTLSKLKNKKNYKSMEHGTDRAVVQAVSDFCERGDDGNESENEGGMEEMECDDLEGMEEVETDKDEVMDGVVNDKGEGMDVMENDIDSGEESDNNEKGKMA